MTNNKKKIRKVYFHSKVLLVLLLVIRLFIPKGYAQHHRLAMNFTIKESKDSVKELYIGRLYYDTYIGQLIYYISFPEKQTWVYTDSFVYKLDSIGLRSKISLNGENAKRFFELVINGNLNSFGMETAPYKIKNVVNKSGFLVKVYTPKSTKTTAGDIHLAYKKKLLESAVFYIGHSDKVIMKNFFKEYKLLSGVLYPEVFYQIIYTKGSELIRKYKFTGVVIDELSSDEKYSIDLKRYLIKK